VVKKCEWSGWSNFRVNASLIGLKCRWVKEAAEKVENADPRGLKPARNEKNKRPGRRPEGRLYQSATVKLLWN